MHYHYFTIEQREALERLIRSRVAAEPELEGALRRLHTPEYGVCEACGADIPFARLMAEPNARRCVNCAL